jgi:choline dehydrogenase-like flavoprotein
MDPSAKQGELAKRRKPAALVIGGGIAGIQAALDIADAGYPVYLVEREPSVGGRMAQLDKTFPTLDCSSCILTPKMVDVGRHPNIELMTYAEVSSVTPLQPSPAGATPPLEGGETASPPPQREGDSACSCARSHAMWMWTSAPAAVRARRRAG